jgi:hypothetical protein
MEGRNAEPERKTPMQSLRLLPLIFAATLALSACGVNYHINPGPNSWPPAPKAPAANPAQKG